MERTAILQHQPTQFPQPGACQASTRNRRIKRRITSQSGISTRIRVKPTGKRTVWPPVNAVRRRRKKRRRCWRERRSWSYKGKCLRARKRSWGKRSLHSRPSSCSTEIATFRLYKTTSKLPHREYRRWPRIPLLTWGNLATKDSTARMVDQLKPWLWPGLDSGFVFFLCSFVSEWSMLCRCAHSFHGSTLVLAFRRFCEFTKICICFYEIPPDLHLFFRNSAATQYLQMV